VIHTVIDGTQGLTWVDVVEPTSAELTEIAHLYGLHPTSVRDCLDPEHLPKFERFPDRYFAIIRVFDVASSADCATVHEMTRKVAIFAGPDFVVTIHRKALPFLTNLQQGWRVDAGEGGTEPLTHRLILDIIDQGWRRSRLRWRRSRRASTRSRRRSSRTTTNPRTCSTSMSCAAARR
jgi:Mg2+ and Co2+ transporter CorA